jgi:hypothetical protein
VTNYLINLAYEHCVITVALYDSPDRLSEDELVAIALEALETDFGTPPTHFHDVEIERDAQDDLLLDEDD